MKMTGSQWVINLYIYNKHTMSLVKRILFQLYFDSSKVQSSRSFIQNWRLKINTIGYTVCENIHYNVHMAAASQIANRRVRGFFIDFKCFVNSVMSRRYFFTRVYVNCEICIKQETYNVDRFMMQIWTLSWIFNIYASHHGYRVTFCA